MQGQSADFYPNGQLFIIMFNVENYLYRNQENGDARTVENS